MPETLIGVPPYDGLVDDVKHALTLSILVAYRQGFHLMTYASLEEKWNLNLEEIGRLWQGGCIIRSAMLPELRASYGEGEAAKKALDATRKKFGGSAQKAWRMATTWGIANGVPLPAMTASIGYFDAMRREKLPQNLIQAQRDFFGAHTYQRTDKEGTFHSDWKSLAQ